MSCRVANLIAISDVNLAQSHRIGSTTVNSGVMILAEVHQLPDRLIGRRLDDSVSFGALHRYRAGEPQVRTVKPD